MPRMENFELESAMEEELRVLFRHVREEAAALMARKPKRLVGRARRQFLTTLTEAERRLLRAAANHADGETNECLACRAEREAAQQEVDARNRAFFRKGVD